MIDKLKGFIPESVLVQLPDTCEKFGINTTLRLAHFLAQCSHESSNFSLVRENLNYSAERLLVIFPKYFTESTAKNYEKNPEKIANRVYAGRMGNGNEASGDGYKHSGRGYIQLTGKDNYLAFDKFVSDNILESPGLVATKYPLMSAAFFFNSRGLWKVCDLGATKEVITKVSKIVNGGTIGLEDRIKLFMKYYKILEEKNDVDGDNTRKIKGA